MASYNCFQPRSGHDPVVIASTDVFRSHFLGKPRVTYGENLSKKYLPQTFPTQMAADTGASGCHFITSVAFFQSSSEGITVSTKHRIPLFDVGVGSLAIKETSA